MSQSKNQDQSNRLWVALIGAPFAMLVFIAFLQIIIHAMSGDTPIIAVLNIISVILGMAAVLALVGLPVWIFMLIKRRRTR